MNITGGITFSGAMGIWDQFPIATAANISAQSLTTGTAISSFNPFASVTSGIPPYTYSYTGTLPSGVTQNTSSGLVSGTPTVAQSSATVTFKVTDSAGVVATVTNAIGFTVAQGPYTVNYLVVAGGGAGGGNPSNYGGGGGGAGEAINSSFTSTPGATYTITVGSGGAIGATGGNGTNSTIDCPPATLTIQCIGGGGGAGAGYPGTNPVMTGKTGGSGGGGGFNYSPLNTAFPGGGANQYPTGSGSFGPYLINPGGAGGINATLGGGTSGGGGGAGSAGAPGSVTAGTAPSYVFLGGAGGSAYQWTYTGSYYAGGGGGGGYLQSSYPGANFASLPGYGSGVAPGNPAKGGGGDGGGYKGNPSSMINATAGSVYTGSGGGGGGGNGAGASTSGANGGSGVVILAIPTPSYPGSAVGASVTTPPSAPGMTVLTYTTSGTYTA
jgi:hypothetical protein